MDAILFPLTATVTKVLFIVLSLTERVIEMELQARLHVSLKSKQASIILLHYNNIPNLTISSLTFYYL
jgi:hypothetical protein